MADNQQQQQQQQQARKPNKPKKLLGDGGLPSDSEPIVLEEKETTFYDSKLFKLIAAGIYIGTVSGLGMMLSIYHLFFWDSTMPILPPNNES